MLTVTPENVALGRLRYTANSNPNDSDSSDAINEGNPGSGEEELVEDELLFVIRRDFTPDDIDTDNTIDHRTIIVPETLVTGAGKDTIIPGRLDDIITPGLDDDTIDPSSDDSDFDEIIDTFTSGSMLVAFDGGDRITGFIPGQDEIRFVDQAQKCSRHRKPCWPNCVRSMGWGLWPSPSLRKPWLMRCSPGRDVKIRHSGRITLSQGLNTFRRCFGAGIGAADRLDPDHCL